MDLSDVVEFSRNFSVMVRVQGPDPKGLKMKRHAFHQYNSGRTTLSASGVLLPCSLFDVDVVKEFGGGDVSVVVTVASVVEDFLSVRYREGADDQVRPELIHGTEIDVMVEMLGASKMENCGKSMAGLTHQWFPAKVFSIIDVPESSLALQSVFGASSSSADNGWEVGWSLSSSSNTIQNVSDGYSKAENGLNNGAQLGNLCAKFVVLVVSSPIYKDLPGISLSSSGKKGDLLLVMGSPFGFLSPLHFVNSIAVGSISNLYPPTSSKKSLLMADIRCLPGMEGAPVYNSQRELIGLITRPARQKSSGAEVQIVIPWASIAASSYDLLRKESQVAGECNDMRTVLVSGKNFQTNFVHSGFLPPSAVECAASSVCLITVDDGAWASGILLNKDGLILTNAHLLEPWRFGKTTVTAGRDGYMIESPFMNKTTQIFGSVGGIGQEYCDVSQRTSVSVDYPLNDKINGNHYSSRSIRVRLGHQYPWKWSYARVIYVSKGPLDVALLQLEHIPDKLSPISVETVCPSPGSQAFVIGHGLFGPRTGSAPSINLGVVAKVVFAKIKTTSLIGATDLEDLPVMLETTATVHPGCSGGAVINSQGFMIGLVTSNSRHGGGTVIPNLNFSIPCAAMKSIFEFSNDMRNLSLLLHLDQPNSQLSSIWSLAPPVSPKTEPSLPKLLLESPNKGTKGSRFARFIADKTHFSKDSTEQAQLAKPSTEKIQSKL